MGRRLVEREARQFGVSLKKLSDDALLRVASEYGCGRIDDLYADLGYGKYSARQVLAKASGEFLEDQPEAQPQKIVSRVKRMLGMSHSAILVRGHDDLMVYRAQCCNPIPGDAIVGYVTRGRGVAVQEKAVRTFKSFSINRSGAFPSNGPTRAIPLLRCGCAYSARTAPAFWRALLRPSVKSV